VSLHRSDPSGERPAGRLAGSTELRPATRAAPVAVGTLACPACDAPVWPGGPLAPADPLACPVCDQGGAVRDFLTLGEPTRAAHVVVRIAERR
jgi:hypothetical protein